MAKKSTLTAAELLEIGERVDQCRPWPKSQSESDRDRIYAAVVRLIERCIMEHNSRFCITGESGDLRWFPTKNAAIDALLQGVRSER